MDLLKMLSTNEVFAQIVSFLILLFLMRRFVWKNFLKVLDGRKEKIALEYKKIEEGKESAGRMQADYEAKLRSIEETAKAKLQEAVLEGRKISEEIKKTAQEDAQKAVEKAKADIKYEMVKVKEELKESAVDLVLSATEKLIKKKVTEEEDRLFVQGLLKNSDKL